MADKTTGNRPRVFVYGTLKEGHGNHEYYLAGNAAVEKLGRCYIRGDYTMYSNGAFPMVCVGTDSERAAYVVGEVYEVDEDTLDALDILEGHPDWYKREKVDTPYGQAWVYLMPERGQYHDDAIVASGCFCMTSEEEEWIRGSEIQAAV